MGYCPQVVQCLPLADLHHFRLTKGFPKTHSAIQPIGTPSAFCIHQIVPGFVVYYLNYLVKISWTQIVEQHFKNFNLKLDTPQNSKNYGLVISDIKFSLCLQFQPFFDVLTFFSFPYQQGQIYRYVKCLLTHGICPMSLLR